MTEDTLGLFVVRNPLSKPDYFQELVNILCLC